MVWTFFFSCKINLEYFQVSCKGGKESKNKMKNLSLQLFASMSVDVKMLLCGYSSIIVTLITFSQLFTIIGDCNLLDLLGPGEQLLLGPQDFVGTISAGPSTVPTMEQMWEGLFKTTRASVSEQFCPLHYLRLLPLESLVHKTTYLNLN